MIKIKEHIVDFELDFPLDYMHTQQWNTEFEIVNLYICTLGYGTY